ncbi:AI-2E family transporter [Herbaspirillum sp. GCM10030257]|uniref:AI-2E family transporter n=1 Tax=Herbaspirillum sp. GCM10030257 TaxID=3273393 RepID=UPI0036129048
MDDKHDSQVPQARSDDTLREERSFLHNAILFYAVGLMFLLVAGIVWYAAKVLLLLFACILVAVLLYDIAQRVQRWLHWPHGPTLALVVVLLLAVLSLAGWLMAPQVSRQVGDLTMAIPQAVDRIRAEAQQYPLLRSLLVNLPPTDQLMSQAASMLSQAGLVFSGVLGAAGNIAIMAFVGVYLAAQPHIYLDGLVTLMPHRKRQRIQEIIAELGRTLGQWLVGKAVTMVIVGAITALGLSLLGVPLALTLGILAGLLDFIPYLGPVIAGVPAVLIAFAESPTLALYTALLFLAVQIAEGYLLSPLIERRTVSLPPALTIAMQVVFGALFGLAGVALATPLTAVLAVLITMLYVQDVLGDPVKTPSEH